MLKKNLAPRPNTNTVGITQSINHQSSIINYHQSVNFLKSAARSTNSKLNTIIAIMTILMKMTKKASTTRMMTMMILTI
jgi:hypothetical protein